MEPSPLHRRPDTAFGMLLALAFALWLAYGFSTPLFEAPDEQHHFFTAHHIAITGALPVAHPATLPRQEAAQPPLYYLAAALAILPLDLQHAETGLVANPLVRPGDWREPSNRNAFQHAPGEGWTPLGLAVRQGRLLSALAGLVTLTAIYATARLLWPQQPWLGVTAAGLVGFLPQFGALHGAVTNDTWAIAFCALALYLLVRAERSGFAVAQLALLALVAALALLTKLSGLLLALYVALALALLAGRAHGAGRALKVCALYVAIVAPPALWLLLRHARLYGDPTASAVFVEFAGGVRPYSWATFGVDLPRVAQSAVGVFGWMNVPAPAWVWGVWLGIAVVALAGLPALLLRRQPLTPPLRPALILTLAGWPLVVAAAWMRFNWLTPADQGRLLFPALLPVALLLACGLHGWRLRPLPALALALALASTAWCAFVLIPSAYPLPAVR